MGGGSSKQKEVAPGPQPAGAAESPPVGGAGPEVDEGEGREAVAAAPETGIDDEADDKPVTYTVTFTRNGSLGIKQMSRTKTEPRVFVKSIDELGQAANSEEQIRPGHLLVGIDGEDVRSLNIAQIFARMAKCGRPCSIEFQPANDDFAVTLLPGEGKFGARIVTARKSAH